MIFNVFVWFSSMFPALGSVLAVIGTVLTALTEAIQLELNFDPSQMFTYTNVITNSMMPLVYISAGFSLGFTIIYALKSAFAGGTRL